MLIKNNKRFLLVNIELLTMLIKEECTCILHILKQQYNLLATREKLYFRFGRNPSRKLHSTVSNFGSGSIIKTHIHVADCYRYWLDHSHSSKKSRFFIC